MSRRSYNNCTPSQTKRRRFPAPTIQSKSLVDVSVAHIKHNFISVVEVTLRLFFNESATPTLLFPKSTLFND